MKTAAACCIFTLLSLGALASSGHAQAPDIEWSHHYPRDGSSAALALALMSDGGFLIGGHTVPPGDVYRDIFLIRTNSDGDTLFTRRFGASDRGESLVSLKPMFDGGFIISGPFNGVPPMTSSADVYLLQIDANVQYVWSNLYGLTTESESPACAIQTVDTALMFVRYQWQSTAGHDIILTGLNAAGGIAWERQYAWKDAEYVVELCRTRDNGLMLAGQTQSADAEYDWDIYLLKTTGIGDSIWCRTFGMAWPSDETATHVVETSDGGFLVSGSRETDTSPKDMLIIKTDSLGLVDWSYEIGSSYHDQARFGIETSDGGYAVVGSWADDTWDNIVIKFDANGDTLWTRIFGDTTTDDVAHAMVETLDGGLVVTGTSSGTAFPGSGCLSDQDWRRSGDRCHHPPDFEPRRRHRPELANAEYDHS